ncbi:MAG: Fur family transcriptional regulator [Rickettsiales bacterium]|jgi:Fur family zinc uptake transcriptional regulator
MKNKSTEISTHGKNVLNLLKKSKKPLTAYDILGKLQNSGVKAPQTVYRALETLIERGMIHRVQSLGAFVACHSVEEDHGTQFAVCRQCKTVIELHDHRICDFIKEIGNNIKFSIEREMLEIIGICNDCKQKT